MSETLAWIGVDLDGTLAYYDEWRGYEHIGEPIPAMVQRVHAWVSKYQAGRGPGVKIFTARVSGIDSTNARQAINHWCLLHLGYTLPITYMKDFGMVELWDDRAVTVERNTGKVIKSPQDQPKTP